MIITVIFGIGLLSCSTAQAYIDPGSANLAIQGLVGLVLGGLFYFRDSWHWLVAKFKGKKPDPQLISSDENHERK